MANADRLLDVLTFLETHPDQHDQGIWISTGTCGTVGCLAGWACLRNGYVELISEDLMLGAVHWGVYIDSDPTKTVLSVFEVAMNLLELDSDDAEWIFDGDNTLEDLWCIADGLTDGEVGRLRAAGRVAR